MLLDFFFVNVNVRIVVSSKEAIHKSQDLSVVEHELSMVDPVVTSAVQDLPSSKSNAVVDGDTPAHNEHQGKQHEVLVHGNNEGHAEVREALNESIDWMESGSSKRIDGNEVVVRLVNVFVENRNLVQDSVSPVDHELADQDKKSDRDWNPSPAVFFNVVIDLAVLGEVTSVDPRSSQARRTDTVVQVPLDFL